ISVVQTAGLPSGSVFPIGKTTNSFTATDASGNSSVCSFDVTVTDNQPPIAIAQNRTIQLDSTGSATISAAEINIGSSDNCSIVSMNLSKTNFDCNNIGDNTVTLTVTDIGGNTTSAAAVVTVVDNVSPIARAKNVTIYLDSVGTASVAAETVDNGSSDNCIIGTYFLSQISFDCSSVGDNTVVLTVIDLSNNLSSDTAIVKVIDNRAPIVITKNITLQLDVNGAASITTADINN